MSIWNEFQYVGYAQTNWERQVTKSGFAFRKLKIEISNNGYTDVFRIIAFEKGAKIDFAKEIKGKLILVSGYNKPYPDKQHPEYDPVIKQVADNILIMENGFRDNARPPKTNFTSDNVKVVENEPEEPQEYFATEEDDLPF